jgi:hypothetical protein
MKCKYVRKDKGCVLIDKNGYVKRLKNRNTCGYFNKPLSFFSCWFCGEKE